MPDPNMKTLQEWEEFFERRIKARTLRDEIRRGRIRAIRVTARCNAPILISATEMDRWLNEVAGSRQLANSPTEVSEIRKENAALAVKGAQQ